MSLAPPADRADRRFDVAAALLIGLALAALGGRGLTAGGLGWSDAPQHFMDGAFLRDLVRDHPADHLRGWAEEYYLRHPALGIGVYWPPGFAAVEAIFFAVGGVSAGAARLCVLAHALVAAWLLYRMATRAVGRLGALFAALLLVSSPHGVLWLGDVMLEWPAVMWILAVVHAAQRYVETRRARFAALAAAAWVMAFMTKQTAGFIGPLLALCALCDQPRRAALLRPAALASGAIGAAVIAAYALAARRVAALPAQLVRPDFSDPAFYLRTLGETAGWPLVAAAAVGAIHAWRGAARGGERPWLPLLWLVAWGGFSSLIAHKEPRYFFFALPPLALLAGECARVGLTNRRLGAAVLLTLCGLQCLSAARSRPNPLPDYAPAVAALAARGDADLVLVDAVRDGQFVVDAYRDPRTRDRLIPLRASKLLYARAARERFGYEQFVHSAADVRALLDRYGVRYVVMESQLPRTDYVEADPPPRRFLRELVADAPAFELLGRWPLGDADPAWSAVELRLYRYVACPARTSDTLTLPMPSMGRRITVRLPRG